MYEPHKLFKSQNQQKLTMKKIIVIFLVLILTTSIAAAAGGGSGGKSIIKRPQTATPEVEEPIKPKEIKCSELKLLNDRVSCRIDLVKKGKETEFDPEECRTANNKEKCRKDYVAANSCWSVKSDRDRSNCFRNHLKFQTIQLERRECLKLEPRQKDECFQELHDKVFSLIKFRFYNLEQKAEYFMQEGADQNTVSEFVTNIERKKQEFNSAKTIQEKKEIIKQVKDLWNKFINEIKPQLKE